MQNVLVNIKSINTVLMTGPAAASPSNATNSGTPMKPVLGKAATKAPKAEFFRSMPKRSSSFFKVAEMVTNTITIAHTA